LYEARFPTTIRYIDGIFGSEIQAVFAAEIVNAGSNQEENEGNTYQ
jgi:hypothetical protein